MAIEAKDVDSRYAAPDFVHLEHHHRVIRFLPTGHGLTPGGETQRVAARTGRWDVGTAYGRLHEKDTSETSGDP